MHSLYHHVVKMTYGSWQMESNLFLVFTLCPTSLNKLCQGQGVTVIACLFHIITKLSLFKTFQLMQLEASFIKQPIVKQPWHISCKEMAGIEPIPLESE
jgi:hypothetical protein